MGRGASAPVVWVHEEAMGACVTVFCHTGVVSAQQSTAQQSTAQHSVSKHGTAQHSTAQHKNRVLGTGSSSTDDELYSAVVDYHH